MRSIQQTDGLRFPCEDRTFKVNKLFLYDLKKQLKVVLFLHNSYLAHGHYGRMMPRHLANQRVSYISYKHQPCFKTSYLIHDFMKWLKVTTGIPSFEDHHMVENFNTRHVVDSGARAVFHLKKYNLLTKFSLELL